MSNELRKMLGKLDEARAACVKLDQYFTGTQPLAYLSPDVREATQGRLQSLVVNWPRLVISAVEERLDIEGFRLPGQDGTDAGLWRLWQAANLDEHSQQAHVDALLYGRSYVSVWADAAGRPSIRVESPRQVHVSYVPGTRTRAYAVKRWQEDGHGHAVLFTPAEVVRFRTVGRVPDDSALDGSGQGWEQLNTFANPLGVVPIVPIVNRPRVLTPDGESEIADLVPIFDAIDKLSTDMMVSSEFHASPRRWATGIVLPETEDTTGNKTGKIDPSQAFSDRIGNVWLAEDASAKFGMFAGADLSGFSNAIASLTQSLGALSGLPPHYLGLHGDQPASADAIRSAEASLVSKARRKMRSFGGSWEEVMRLAHTVEVGYFAPELQRLETVWRDPETRTVAQAVDAASKAVAANIMSADFAAEFYLGLTPTQIERNRELRRAAALDAAVTRVIER